MVEYHPRHALVTGGAGFIGSNFVRHWLNSDATVKIVNLDLLTYAGSLTNLDALPDSDRHVFVRGDIRDGALVGRLLSQYTIDTIIHFAAESHVDRSINRPSEFVQTNVAGTLTLLEAAREYWLATQRLTEEACRFQHISTDEVYGSLGFSDPPFTESSPCLPNSPYAASKAGADHLVRAYHQTYGLPIVISRCSNNYGPHQFPEKLIPLILDNAIKGRPLPVYGDGVNVRDWIYVEDHCEALLRVLHGGGSGQIYNIGGGSEKRNIDVVYDICDYLDQKIGPMPFGPRKSLIRFVQDRPGHDLRYGLDTTKIRSELGWKPKIPFPVGISRTIDWYLQNQNWVEKIVNGGYRDYYDELYGSRLCHV